MLFQRNVRLTGKGKGVL